MPKFLNYIGIVVLIFGLILVRKFENELFYDPFLEYFKGDSFHSAFPQYDLIKIVLHVSFRYVLNSLLSLGIIYLLFRDWKKVKFAALVLLVFWIVLLPIYLYMVETQFTIGSNVGFYVRRFLIQPLLLLILIPAFYYQQFMAQNQKSTEDF